MLWDVELSRSEALCRHRNNLPGPSTAGGTADRGGSQVGAWRLWRSKVEPRAIRESGVDTGADEE
jgi:hypothetical protein